MALANLTLGLPPLGVWICQNSVTTGKPGFRLVFCCNGAALACASGGRGSRVFKGLDPASATGLSSASREVLYRDKLKVDESLVDGKNRSRVEIPVTCYQMLGISEQAEKDEIARSVMELKGSDIEDGYTEDTILSRQNVLMDVRDKLLFEPEYAGDTKEKIPPKSTLCIPWAWLSGAMCLLQEVGEEKKVLEIGRAALQHQDAKPFVHDLLLSIALTECSIAKAGFEKNKVSQGFEALARAQYILRSKASFEDMPLISQIEESLEELAPTCTLEILDMPCTSDNIERRSGAVAALCELLRQGLEVEASCKVQDWPTFLNQALNKLMASEIVDLLPWDDLAITRKNKKSLESQSQRTVIEFDCLYLAMISHLALGFSRRQTDLINKAKIICECLVASEGVDLKYEEGICTLLLGQDLKTFTIEKLHNLEINGRPVIKSRSNINKEPKGSSDVLQSLEIFLKNAVLDVFPDTRGFSPSLDNFFRGQRKLPPSSKSIDSKKPSRIGLRSTPLNLSHDNQASKEAMHLSSSHLGEAVKQLAPANLQSQLTDGKGSGVQNFQLKRELGMQKNNFWESWWVMGDFTRRLAHFAVAGCIVLSSFVLCMQSGQNRIPYKVKFNYPNTKTSSTIRSLSASESGRSPAFIGKETIVRRLGEELLVIFRKRFKNPSDAKTSRNNWSTDEHSKVASTGDMVHRRQMSQDEAETVLKLWQTVKAEALGPNHKGLILSEILAEPMLSQWRELADTAKANSCFWRFVLLQIHVLRAEIISDGVGDEKAEIEAVLEEAAELVDGYQAQSKNPNYYSTYKMNYLLKRQFDGSWKFYSSDIISPV